VGCWQFEEAVRRGGGHQLGLEIFRDLGWLASSGKFCCKNLAKTSDQVGSHLEVATALFSRFFITTTPNCC
jgi:hypothetical protein